MEKIKDFIYDKNDILVALLVLVFGISIFYRTVDQIHIGAGHALGNGGAHGFIMCVKGFHRFQLSFMRCNICMVALVLRSAF